MSVNRIGQDEEVVELDMPRPRSISRRPEAREPQRSPEASVNGRRESDAKEMQKQSVIADDEALANITRDVQRDAKTSTDLKASVDAVASHSPDYVEAPEFRADTQAATSDEKKEQPASDDESPDEVFRTRMQAVQPSDVEAVLSFMRTDPDSSIRQDESAATVQRPAVEAIRGHTREAHASPVLPYSSTARSQMPAELMAMLASTEALDNPTHDQQYLQHRGSRGISPPPGFDDSAIPSYQDSSEVPAYHNVVSQPPGLPVAPSAHALESIGILPESERPEMTDKFMNAHIARHGSSSLSPLALLTPDQADMLPEYVLSGTAFDGNDSNRGRSTQTRPLGGHTREITKAEAEIEAVREVEEREALNAIEAMEALRLNGPSTFDDEQLAALAALGDEANDYYSPSELRQFQRLASDPDDAIEPSTMDNDEAELLQMMAQYVRRSPTLGSPPEDDAHGRAREQMEELEDMLRDRVLTENQRSVPRTEMAAHSSHPGRRTDSDIPQTIDPEVLAILRSVAQIRDEPTSLATVQPTNQFSNSEARTGVDVEALRDAALARKGSEAQSSHTESATGQQAQTSAGYGGGHGVKKSTMEPAAYAAQQARNAKKAESYIALAGQVTQLRGHKDVSQSTFDLTTKLLKINPEYYTIWNYRREIMLQGLFPDADETTKQALLSSELKLLQAILQDYPKIYWIWNHRKWCLSQCPWPDWARELLLVTKMLEQDARNFHVWEYRRYVIAQIEQAEESSKAERELEYTTAAINSNFSNFSAWHNRTKLIPQVLVQIEDDAGRDTRRREMLKDELELIKGAIYTDPDDQSVWLYHRWLLNPDSAHATLHPLAPTTRSEHVNHLTQELAMIEELMEEEPDNIWCTYAKVHYTLSLRRLDEGGPHDESQTEEVRRLMSVLEANDTLREGRYREWKESSFDSLTGSTTGEADDRAAALALEFAVFDQLRQDAAWSDVSLHQDGYVLGTRRERPCLVVLGWSSMSKIEMEGQERQVMVATRDDAGRVRFYSVAGLV